MRDDDESEARGRGERAQRDAGIDRRAFLRGSARVGLGSIALLSGCDGAGAEDAATGGRTPAQTPEIRRRSVLGRTGIEIPDIGFGGWGLDGQDDVVRHALDRGVTHFDSAPDYADGRSEETIGRALAGDRARVTLSTKCMARADATRDEIMRSLEGSLRRLRTDRVDVFFNHAVNRVERIRNPEWSEFVARAKQQGKIRASGMSGHGGRLAECVDAAIDDDLADVFLLAHNYANLPSFWTQAQRFKDVFTGGFDFVAYQSELPRLLERAHASGHGVMVMKTRRGAQYNDLSRFRRDGASPTQAALRWVLAGPHVHGLIVTMLSREEVDHDLVASGASEPTLADTEALLRHEARNAGALCQLGCGDCASACPAGVDVAGALRARMYAERYARPDVAAREYAALAAPAAACATCASPVCRSACPGDLDIRALASGAHRALAPAPHSRLPRA
ncbi:MAG: aldo/keto reductase [Myxococcota bacterium]